MSVKPMLGVTYITHAGNMVTIERTTGFFEGDMFASYVGSNGRTYTNRGKVDFFGDSKHDLVREVTPHDLIVRLIVGAVLALTNKFKKKAA